MIVNIIVALLFVLNQSVLCGKLPSDLRYCKQHEPNFSTCLKDAIQDALPKVKDGIPALAVPAIDPLKIERLLIEDTSGSVSLIQKYENIFVKGFATNSIVKSYNINDTDYTGYGEIFTSRIEFYGDYELDGRVILFPIQGKGKCNITLHDVDTIQHMKGEPFIKNGKRYWKITDYNFSFTPKNVDLDYENLFNGDKTLKRLFDNLVKENWMVIFDEQKPKWQYVLSKIFKDIVNRVFIKVPFNQIILP